MARGFRMARRWTLAPAACAFLIAGPVGQAGAVPPNVPEPGWPSVDGPVTAMALSGGRLYIGGFFSHVGGQSHDNVAALDAATGAVDPGFTAGTDGSVDALAVSGSRLYLGGMFRKVDSPIVENRIRVAAVDTATGNLDSGFASEFTQGVPRALAV